MDIILNRGLLSTKDAKLPLEMLSEKILSYISASREAAYFYAPLIAFDEAELLADLLKVKPVCIVLRDCFDAPGDLRRALYMVGRYRALSKTDAIAIYVYNDTSAVYSNPEFIGK